MTTFAKGLCLESTWFVWANHKRYLKDDYLKCYLNVKDCYWRVQAALRQKEKFLQSYKKLNSSETKADKVKIVTQHLKTSSRNAMNR